MKARMRTHADVNIWPPGFTDIAITMILILVFFIFCQFLLTASKILARIEIETGQEKIRREFEKTFKQKIKNKTISIVADGNLQRFRFSDKILFDEGQAILKYEGKEILTKVGRIFRARSNLYNGIHIEGHTDNIPIGAGLKWRYSTNWELSSARATSVVRLFQDEIGIKPDLLSATGYSEYQPIGINKFDRESKPLGNPLNRRIEIVLIYSEAQSLEKLKK